MLFARAAGGSGAARREWECRKTALCSMFKFSQSLQKRSLLEEYREQKRGGKGVFTLKANSKTGKLISIMEVVDDDDLMIITDTGIMIRQSIDKLNIIGRNTQGVKLLRLDDNSSIASVTKVIKEDEGAEEDIEGINENNQEE